MQIVLDIQDFVSAPSPVQLWLISKMGVVAESLVRPIGPAYQENPIEKPIENPVENPIEKPVAKQPVPEMRDLLERAVRLIESKGEAALSDVLKKVGIARVKECPEEKRAALLTELAIHG